MDSGDLHYCEAFPDNAEESSLAEDASPSQKGDQFLGINVKLTETKLVFNPRKDDFDCFNDNTAEYRFINIPLAATETTTLLILLSDIGVPEDARDSMAFKILACARGMAQTTHKTRKLLPICVLIYITTSVEGEAAMDDSNEEEESTTDDTEEEEEEAGTGDGEEEQDGLSEETTEDQLDTDLVPETASYEEPRELEKLKIGESGLDVGICTVCLEKYVIGSEAVRLRCLHLFHEICIMEWLRRGNSWLCPLCRFRCLEGRTGTGDIFVYLIGMWN